MIYKSYDSSAANYISGNRFFLEKGKTIDEFITKNAYDCHLCGHNCGASRRQTADINGKVSPKCGATWHTDKNGDWLLKISSINLHYGEEPPISGHNGSGTIFFTHCSLKCVFCQNYPISALGNGRFYTIKELAQNMLRLQSEGAHNINLVSPTHYAPLIAAAINHARLKGLTIPIVYNTGGYDSVETLRELDGLIDIYLPDIKYHSPELAAKFSGAPNYPAINKKAIKEMRRQVGDLQTSDDGIAKKGILIRHLVLPDCVEDTKKILEFIAAELSPGTYVSIMSQYHPAYEANKYPSLRRKLHLKEYQKAVDYAHDQLGLENAFIQEV